MAKITEGELLLISKASQETLKGFSQGVQLSVRSGKSIDELKARVAMDRLRLAGMHLKAAYSAARAQPAQQRAAISRAYYSMYHAARAATYLAIGGDDHEQHSVLPGKLPADFPKSDEWKNKLKDARLERNRADYDPYPGGDVEFGDTAKRLVEDARSFMKLARAYLRTKT